MSDQFTTERDGYGRLLADREVWRQASTLAAAGELTARWLEGTSEYQPGTLAPRFDDETLPIAGQLAELNRSGLFTKESQPGLGPDAGHAQREYVTGFCSAESAALLLRLSAGTELIAIAHAPGEVSQASVPVTLHDGEVVTVLGSSENPVESEQIQDWARESNETLALLLADSWYVELLDPVWGRQQHLLPAVLETLTSAHDGLHA
ncbi:hypothetical protein ARGLB_093_00120 [Arthrobacter globiformis NBRC 12137]|jgi:hypothetical protein|uniref:DUF6919 domain-containing protein n=1 Tax=Arthrobacter globiformis (strain ATCC 8010 / DSM 20124 / JCM 1332 / NBRC 12137 / NCIMB 8907 / NRRL B-2979 / 168) TaxID=1077972 RepID=H0QSQ8_ARTG1|nr:hypothetical protein [Arthrobacter globiformis]GAB15859.1 hypothetical protein ARGLB_093_00120 [Arthrobacter globiformis NBRC 12137]